MVTQNVIILDAVFTRQEAAAQYAILLDRQYRDEIDSPDALKFGPSGMISELSFQDSFVQDVLYEVQERYSTEGLMPYRAYVNRYVASDHPYPHRDQTPESEPPHVMTVLYYVNPKWEYACGGETVFYSDDGRADVVKAVRPRAGRMILFFGDIGHSARPPLPHCKDIRLTVAVKYLLDPELVAVERDAGAQRDL
jgi:Rps23 Pro-64 3,4-dihydroxylase Tpa1-like proline 4-hydroxylase